MMKRFFKWCLIVFAGLFAVYLIALGLFSIQPQVYDADLRPVTGSVPENENAFSALQQAAAKIWWPKENSQELLDLVNDTNWNASLASTALAQNAEALKLMDAASQMRVVQVPAMRMGDSTPYLSDWDRLSGLASIRANALFHSGQEREAFQQAVALVRLGRLLEENQNGDYLAFLVGSRVKARGLRRIRGWVASTRLAPAQLSQVAAELEAVPDDSAPLAEVLKREYRMSMQFLADVRARRAQPTPDTTLVKIKLAPVYNHGRTKGLFAAATRQLIKGSDVPYSQAKLPDLGNRSLPKIVLGGNLAREACYFLFMPRLEGAVKRRCQETVELQTTRVLLAMRAYQIKHGKLPTGLSELVPEFIPSVPTDPFNGEPLLYSPDKKAIYSVGENLRDDEGDIAKEESRRQLDYGCAVTFLK